LLESWPHCPLKTYTKLYKNYFLVQVYEVLYK
jgi:hypothetical protein